MGRGYEGSRLGTNSSLEAISRERERVSIGDFCKLLSSGILLVVLHPDQFEW